MTAGLIQEHDLTTVLDMEAGLEHLSRGTARNVDVMLVVVEPYYRALEIGMKAAELSRELGIRRVYGLANKVRTETDRKAIAEMATRHGVEVLAYVPYDPAVGEAEAAGRAVVDVSSASPMVAAVDEMTVRLLALSGRTAGQG